MEQKTLVFTGHRPPKLGFSYDVNSEEWNGLRNDMKEYIVNGNFTDVWSGMALGTDTLAALVALDLRDNENYPVKLHCAVPCRNYFSKWVPASQKLYNEILSKADEVVYVKDGEYDEFCLSHRNFFMVDKADEIFAVWSGMPTGGTYEAITYGKYKNIPIHISQVYKVDGGTN